MPAAIPIGIDSFVKLRQLGLEYVDKSFFIQAIIEDIGSEVLLLPRPRRFGKTVNLTMLETFFSCTGPDHLALFRGLLIEEAGEPVWKHFRRYPTVFITLKSLKPQTPQEWQQLIALKLSELFMAHLPVLERDGLLNDREKVTLDQLTRGTADKFVTQRSLFYLTEWLHRAYGEPVMMLIDEYDTPVHAGWLADQQSGRSSVFKPGQPVSPDSVYAEVVDFYRTCFGHLLKGNPHLFKGVLTGILRVSKESIFSDLNNITVRTLLESEYSTCFGFTEAEVVALCERQEQTAHLDAIRQWYNGYRFGGNVIYNPWSVLYFLGSMDKKPKPYWLNSSGNDLIKTELSRNAMGMHEDFQRLLEGKTVERSLQRNFSFSELEGSVDSLYSLLVFSGYLKAEQVEGPDPEVEQVALSIPNREVRQIWRESFQQWLNFQLGGGLQVQELQRAILTGDARRLEKMLGRLGQHILSFMDGDAREPEALYHGLMLGLCASMEPVHWVRSNRESGLGRADILILPSRSGQAGAVLELKVADEGPDGLQEALAEGRQQLLARHYRAELEAAGASPLQQWVVAFDGKTVKVERVTDVA